MLERSVFVFVFSLLLLGCEDFQKCHCHVDKYADKLPKVLELITHFDLEEALFCGASCNKPVLLEFISHGATSEPESRILRSKQLVKLVSDRFVYVQLYIDDKTIEADSTDWVISDEGKVLKMIGKINSHYQGSRFNSNSLPLYIMLDQNNEVLGEPGHYMSTRDFKKFLKNGLEIFNAQSNAN